MPQHERLGPHHELVIEPMTSWRWNASHHSAIQVAPRSLVPTDKGSRQVCCRHSVVLSSQLHTKRTLVLDLQDIAQENASSVLYR
jgi:hypothetical protein